MLKQIFVNTAWVSATVLLAACSNMTQYERQVQDWEPVYCYKSIGAVQCYKEPKHSDSRRLVNFYGPAPSQYDKPDEPEYSSTKPPKMIDYWTKDAEPIPQAAPPKTHTPTPGPDKAMAPDGGGEDEEVSLMDNIFSFFSGKPELSNKPVAVVSASPAAPVEMVAKPLASVAAPLQPAPTAQPVIAVESGTL